MESQEILRNIKMSNGTGTTQLNVTGTQSEEDLIMPAEMIEDQLPGGQASVRIKLKKVDDYQAKDSRMNAVFGVAPRGTKNTHTLKVNPLYDRGGAGIIEVKPEDAKRAEDIKKRTLERQRHRSSGGYEGQYSELPVVVTPDENHTKINYSKNFMYAKNRPGSANGNINGNSRRSSHIRNEGILVSARIQKNASDTEAVVGSSPVPSNSAPAQIPNSEQERERKKNRDLEAAERKERHRRKTGRIIILLLLAILILALISALIIYFITN